METEQQIEINTKLGLRQIDKEKIIYFPKGLAGLDGLHEYILLQIRPEIPMLILQSIQVEAMGLVVVNPHTYIDDYKYKLDVSEQKLLHLENKEELLILVTVTIPHGKPEETCLNLNGPILINMSERVGLQIMQIDNKQVEQFKLSQVMGAENAPNKNQVRSSAAKQSKKIKNKLSEKSF